jgi:hypothetical protein
MRKEAWSRVALYIAKTTLAFVGGGKKTIVIPYFFKVSFTCTFSFALKYICLS